MFLKLVRISFQRIVYAETGRCPVAISDLVLLHNKSTECQAKKDPLGLDVYEKLADLKREFIKYCKPFETSLRKNVPSHRVIAQEEEQSTDIMIPGFIVDKNVRCSKKLGPSKINLQFLQHHKDNYLELHHELAKISYSPQSDAALTNYKTLLELEISLLMGCNIKWGGASDFVEPAAAAGALDAVLVVAGHKDVDDDSSTEGGCVGAVAAAGPARPADATMSFMDM
jgi:hypothetical protein